MRLALALALGLAAGQPAEASCHRFKIWKYPTPQRCEARAYVPVHRAVQKPTAPDDERVDIEITITPELLETWDRQDALAKIKGELK